MTDRGLLLGKQMQSYVLAAGRGLRAGGPKAWLESGGTPLLKRQVGFLLSVFRPEDIAVSIQEPWRERCLALDARVKWVGVDPALPAMASLQALLRASPPKGWAFVHHVDMPVWDRTLFKALADGIPAGTESGVEARTDAVIPVHGGRRGHPVALSPKAAQAVLRLDPASGRLDAWLKGARTRIIEVPQSCVLDNWNQGAPR